MPLNEDINFVNRVTELDTLRNRIPPFIKKNTLTFLLSPSGFGKSTLTDRLIETVTINGPTCVVVDPAIRSKGRSDRIYSWLFVQRAAESTAVRKKEGRREFRTFSEFLRRTKYSRINWKHVYENLKEALSLTKIFKSIIELSENLIKKGRYNPEAILQDDSPFATQLAQDYVRALSSYRPTLFIVRECQNIDLESLRFFLTLGQGTSDIAVIFEYTTSDNRFSPDHEKIIFDTVSAEDSLVIFDLLRLNIEEFRLLLQKYALADKTIEAAAELAWDGNLRIIKEIKYRLMLGRSIEASHPLLLSATIKQNLELLPKRRRLILAIIASHVEAIGFDTLLTVLKRIDPELTTEDIKLDLKELATKERYIHATGHIALADEDLLEALNTSLVMKPMLRLAETNLRDFYLDIVKGNVFASVPLQSALRQAIALCARTGDIVALRGLVKTLDSTIQQAHDQTLYVNIVAWAVLSHEDLSDFERRELVEWGAAAAYEVGDYPTVISLLETLPEAGSYETALLACCYGEVNRHEEAVALARLLRTKTNNAHSEIALAGKLIECANLFALGRKQEAARLHTRLQSDAGFSASPLFGYVLRYTEIIKDFPECTSDVLQSADKFRTGGFRKSAAYSQLAGAIHLAYSGKVAEARQLIANAETELLSHVRDRQIILNNAVVVELLSSQPDIAGCISKLNSALFTVRDDFSRLALQNNRLICFWLSGDLAQAVHCAEVIERILAAPGFGNRDIFWTVCFNVWSFFREIGNKEMAERFRSITLTLDLNDSCYPDYWKARFGLASKAGSDFDFMMRFKYHPEYLSHWVIDLEGLSVLKAKHVQ